MTKHALNPTNPTRTLCGATEATAENVAHHNHLVTCKRCLKVMAATNAPAAEPVTPAAEPVAPTRKFRPFAVVMDEQSDRVDAALEKPSKESKPSKPATIHLHDTDRHPTYQTWCKIPGQHTTDPDAVTCKVCRAHIDGKAPLNAVPERVKQARKSFKSFVARVAYMVHMDASNTNTEWLLNHTNMAGTEYIVTWSQTLGYRVMEDGEIITTDLGQDIKQWMEDHWSCGEEK